jgi:signal transduction histidine kinase
VLHSLLPGIPWTITTHLEYLSLFLSVAFFSFYTKHLFPEDTGRWVVGGNAFMCLAMALVVIVMPPQVFTQLINPFLFVMFSIIAYAFWVYVKAMRNRRLGAGYALVSTGVLLAVFLMINLEYFGFVMVPKALLFFGYASFFFLQSLILSFRFAFTLTSAKRAAEEGAAAKSEFLSTMSHEIRTPLNAITGMTHLILRDNPRPDQAERLNILQHSAANLLVIVNDILDFSKIEAGKVTFEFVEMDMVDLARIVVEGQRLSAESKSIGLRLHADPALHRDILGDPARLTQILTNLVSNAIKFTVKAKWW